MTKVNITASESNEAPSQPTDGQQPGQQNQQQNDQINKDKPAQQSNKERAIRRPGVPPGLRHIGGAMHNNLAPGRMASPVATVTPTSTAIYNPPGDGFPFMAAVFSPDGAIQAFRAFPSRRDAEGFLQAFIQENAGEYGLR